MILEGGAFLGRTQLRRTWQDANLSAKNKALSPRGLHSGAVYRAAMLLSASRGEPGPKKGCWAARFHHVAALEAFFVGPIQVSVHMHIALTPGQDFRYNISLTS